MASASKWTPITLEELCEKVLSGEQQMDRSQLRLWELIQVEFTKWQLHPWGDLGGGFWVVGVVGSRVLWYNDIEEGFNWSRYSTFGTIDEYWCNQDQLNHSMYQLQNLLDGYPGLPHVGPPQSVPVL